MVKSKLLDHYHALLKAGRDTRAEGLVWIIREIILLGSNVKLSCLPNFLDEASISYLFKYTKLDLELKKVSEEKIKIKMLLKKKKDNSKSNFNSTFLFKTSVNKFKKTTSGKDFSQHQTTNTIRELYHNYIDAHNFEDETQITLKTVTEFLDNKISLDGDTKNILKRMESHEAKENDYKEVLNEIKKSEMGRIFKEFARNEYERRFNINKAIVISALIGEDYTTSELIRQSRELKVLFYLFRIILIN